MLTEDSSVSSPSSILLLALMKIRTRDIIDLDEK